MASLYSRLQIVLVVLAMGGSTLVLAKDNPYTMADLRALADSSSWSEMVPHLTDVPPASRNQEWDHLVEKAAIGYVKSLDPKTEAGGTQADELLRVFPKLKASQAFMALRGSASLSQYEECFKNSYSHEECAKELVKFVKAHPDAATALAAAKLVTSKYNGVTAAPLFKLALTDGNRAEVCKDKLLQRSVVEGIERSEGEERDAAVDIASNHCWAETKQILLDNFSNQSAPVVIQNYCMVLKPKKVLKGLRAKKCS